MCAASALRSGVGLVKIATDPTALPTAIAIEPGATGIVLEADVNNAVGAIDQADPSHSAVLAVGPGMGTTDRAQRLVLALLGGNRQIVLDADGLNLLAISGPVAPRGSDALVMTPHPGEFSRLAEPLGISLSATDPAQRPAAAAALATSHNAVVVLKGPSTAVSDGTNCYINTTGNAALATAGSGDVLTGLIAALIAQGMSPLDSAVLGTYLHGMAADIFAERHGISGLTATTLAELLPDAFDQHRRDTSM